MLVSCSSIGKRAEYPVWIDSEPSAYGYIIFVGYGEGQTQKDARDNAYEDSLIKMGQELGYDPREFYLRELIAYDEVPALGCSVFDYYEEEVNGVWRSWVRIDCQESVLLEARSEEYSNLLDREARISVILDEALSEYRINRDVGAINKILEAVLVSLEGPVNNPSYTPNALIDRAIGYAQQLQISLRHESDDNIEATVRVSRTKGWFYPRVEEAMVLSTYTILTNSQEYATSTYVSKTNENGEFRFYSTSPIIVKDGRVEFSIILDENCVTQINELDSGLLNSLISVLDSKKAFYDYHEEGHLDKQNTLIVLSQVDINGRTLSDDTFRDTFISFLKDAKSEGWTIIKDTSDADEDELVERIANLYPNVDNIIISRIGIVDVASSAMHSFAKTEGYSLIYKRTDDSPLSLIKSQHSFAFGVAESSEAAQIDGVINQARISASLLLEVL